MIRPDKEIVDSVTASAVQVETIGMTTEAILSDFATNCRRDLGQGEDPVNPQLGYDALTRAVMDRLIERWKHSSLAKAQSDSRSVSYLSLEFLTGRLLRNALMNLGIEHTCAQALSEVGLELDDLIEQEHDAGLGNGGLGRLAACFLDSCATLRLPVTGYGLRYRYGMFRQCIEQGYQREEPDPWLRAGFAWEVERFELAQTVQFGGRSELYTDTHGNYRYRWVSTHDVLAIPFDVPVPGYRNEFVNTLRLWSAAATDEFDLDDFNAGDYAASVAEKNAAENITMVLYPNAVTEMGRELRLRQQYFLASASLKDRLRTWTARHGHDFRGFAAKHCFQLNDTHPAIAVAELQRLLVDEYQLGWDAAWEITQQTMAYTNHTLLPEALEVWSVSLFERLLPRVLEIIYEIDARFVNEIHARWPDDTARVQRMSLIDQRQEPVIRMAYLAIVGSYSVNGVAQLHSDLLCQGLFRDFYEMWPERFNNKTNGVTQRRWLAACNPLLSELVSETIGEQWVTQLDQLEGLRAHAESLSFQQRWRAVKQANKTRLASLITRRCGVRLDPSMMFDIQVKRIHEYKRQLLNILHVIHLYDRIVRGEDQGMVPRAVIIGGKAAPGYAMAKLIIKCINNVAEVINNDPLTSGKLRLVFVPDYNVSVMEVICPAADVSEQVSTAGKEASGTGNMKFMMNGALTIGTLDGANIEIREAVGKENFFLFGLTVDEISQVRSHYDPDAIIAADPDFRSVMHLLESGHFNRNEPGEFDAITLSVRDSKDEWMTAADFRSFVDAQQRVNEAFKNTSTWTRMSILNSAASGVFSTDRTMEDYNRDIWHVSPVTDRD